MGKEGSTFSIPKGDVPVEKMNEGDPEKITLQVCKSYLRTHGLRLKGTKTELIERIKLHIELTEEGPRKYQLPTFVVDCTGDVCKGDVILFTQKLRAKSDAASRRISPWRSVAGRVVNDSYGTLRQQHTFTIEVLWVSGYKQLRPMKQLLIKGRNLYRTRIRRQLWPDEQARKKILEEKHNRGDVARQIRASRKGIICHVKKKKSVKVRPLGPIKRISSAGWELSADPSLPRHRKKKKRVKVRHVGPIRRISPGECELSTNPSLPMHRKKRKSGKVRCVGSIERISPDECELSANPSPPRNRKRKKPAKVRLVGPAKRKLDESNLSHDPSLPRHRKKKKRMKVRHVGAFKMISSDECNLSANPALPKHRKKKKPRRGGPFKRKFDESNPSADPSRRRHRKRRRYYLRPLPSRTNYRQLKSLVN